MFNFIRGSVYLAVTGNLTYVHHPLRATHGADVASLDRVLGLPTASKCDAVCAERMIANRFVHVVSYSFAKPRPFDPKRPQASLRHPPVLSLERALIDHAGGRNSSAAAYLENWEATLAAARADAVREGRKRVLLDVRGCPRKYLVTAEMRAWFLAAHDAAQRDAATRVPLSFRRDRVVVALHFRSPDTKAPLPIYKNGTKEYVGGGEQSHDEFCAMWPDKCLTSGYYAAVVGQAVRWAGVSRDEVDVVLFTEGKPKAQAQYDEIQAKIPGLQVRRGNGSTFASDIAHLAAADVLVTANSGVSLIAATLSRGVLLVGSNHDYIRQSDGLPNRVSCDVATGACDRRAFAAGWRRAVESKCARRGAAQPVDRGAAVGWDGLCS